MAVVKLKKGEGRTIKAGGAWIFDNEIDVVMGEAVNGTLVQVVDFDDYPMGSGFYNANSKIVIRMLTRKKDQEINWEFIKERVSTAYEYRKVVMGEDFSACRILFGEADFLPGLVVDRYENVLVVESLAMGIDCLKRSILRALLECFSRDGITMEAVYERSDAPVRKKEGMNCVKGILPLSWILDTSLGLWDQYDPETRSLKSFVGVVPTKAEEDIVNQPVEIVENGVHYLVDVICGQKTGFFLDQKYNRKAMQELCRNYAKDPVTKQMRPMRVLDCFTHMGTFALNCGLAGACDVTGLDISEFAVGQATANAKRNGLENQVKFRTANVLDELPRLYEAGEKFDVVILDPPAFTKSREATKNAIKGYREINMKGLKLVKDGGYLASCSCSHFMTQELLTKTIQEAAKAVHKRIRQIEFRTQAPDHPILWAADESYYLKFFIFQVVDEK
ncbi:MAG: class I SAM-dependent rRNA methyltransferase [Lachnospiraceae bacterium]|nr:class I SAM-dependent rRNA methyltransferase [Lachnospiraceae bacterium]